MNGIVSLYKANMEVKEVVPVYRLPFKAEKVIEKSIEMFSDPDPCAVYTSASCTSLGLEFIEIALVSFKDREYEDKILDLESLPQELLAYLELPKDVMYISFK